MRLFLLSAFIVGLASSAILPGGGHHGGSIGVPLPDLGSGFSSRSLGPSFVDNNIGGFQQQSDFQGGNSGSFSSGGGSFGGSSGGSFGGYSGGSVGGE